MPTCIVSTLVATNIADSQHSDTSELCGALVEFSRTLVCSEHFKRQQITYRSLHIYWSTCMCLYPCARPQLAWVDVAQSLSVQTRPIKICATVQSTVVAVLPKGLTDVEGLPEPGTCTVRPAVAPGSLRPQRLHCRVSHATFPYTCALSVTGPLLPWPACYGHVSHSA